MRVEGVGKLLALRITVWSAPLIQQVKVDYRRFLGGGVLAVDVEDAIRVALVQEVHFRQIDGLHERDLKWRSRLRV